jgi:tetratricopeptide (TPR) repeat protein
MSSFKTCLLSAALTFLPVSAQAVGTGYNAYALAENDYNQKRFEQALRGFEQALRENSGKNKVVVHYMKANCLVQMNQPAEADKEYAVAQSLAPGSQIAKYCEVARANIKRLSLTQNAASRTMPPKNADDDDDENSDEQKTTAASTQAKNNPAVSPATLDLIAKQAALARQHALEIGNIAAENERTKAANEGRSLQAKLERAAFTPRGGTEPVALTPQQIEGIKNQAAAGSEQLRQAGEWKALQRKQESEDKSEEIRRQAENLQSQLINYRPNINSDIKLNPIGTNFYIRNYSKGIAPITALKAQTKMLPSYKNATEGIQGTVVPKPTSLNKVDARGTSSATPSSLTVKGQLIGLPKPTQAEHP